MLIKKQGTVDIWEFDSYSEFVKRGMGPAEFRKDNERQSRNPDDDSFAGGTWEMAARVAPVGDLQQAEKLRKSIIKEATRVMGSVARLDPIYREEGGIWIDVSRYLSGEPEVWGDLVAQGATRKSRHVTLAIIAGVNSNVTASQYAKTAELIGGAVLGLRASGYSVGCWIMYRTAEPYGSRMNGNLHSFPLTGKDSSGSLDVAKLAAVLTPWFFRRIKFAVMETMDKDGLRRFDIRIRGGAYGSSTHATPKQVSEITGFKDTHIVHLKDLIGRDEDAIREALIPKEALRS